MPRPPPRVPPWRRRPPPRSEVYALPRLHRLWHPPSFPPTQSLGRWSRQPRQPRSPPPPTSTYRPSPTTPTHRSRPPTHPPRPPTHRPRPCRSALSLAARARARCLPWAVPRSTRFPSRATRLRCGEPARTLGGCPLGRTAEPSQLRGAVAARAALRQGRSARPRHAARRASRRGRRKRRRRRRSSKARPCLPPATRQMTRGRRQNQKSPRHAAPAAIRIPIDPRGVRVSAAHSRAESPGRRFESVMGLV